MKLVFKGDKMSFTEEEHKRNTSRLYNLITLHERAVLFLNSVAEVLRVGAVIARYQIKIMHLDCTSYQITLYFKLS